MMNSSRANPLFEILPKEMRLASQAKSGDVNAFVNLYDACVERAYCYVHSLVPNTKVAEGLTFKVFFKAWENLDHYQMFNSSFIAWLYSIAQDQIIAYYNIHKEAVDPDDDFTAVVKGGNFRKEFQVVRDGLHLLPAEQQQALVLKCVVGMPDKNIGHVLTRPAGDVGILLLQGLQALTKYLQGRDLKIEAKGFQGVFEEYLLKLSNGISILDECWALYPEYADQLGPLLKTALLLNLGRDVKPSPTFVAYTHEALIQYLWSHPRRSKTFVTHALRRTALSFAMLVAVFLVTGTAQAQSALPGDAFYGWKRTSERVWRTLSPDPVATDIILAERRLDEWITVSEDAALSTSAEFNYVEALSRLESTTDKGELTRILPALQLQHQTLEDAGLASSELTNYLDVVTDDLAFNLVQDSLAQTIDVPASASTDVVPTQAEGSSEIVPAETEALAEIVPAETKVPTEIVPAETEVPTEIVPAESEAPTEIVPTEEVPTEVAPTEEVPTEVAPTEEDPTEVAPTEEDPTEVVPVETEAPVPVETVPPVAVPTPPTEAPSTEQVP